MSLFKRFKDVLASNVNEVLEKTENPAKMADQYIRNAEIELMNTKQETAALMAEEKRAIREAAENKNQIQLMTELATKAVKANNDEDAKKFLEQKAMYEEKQKTLDQVVENIQKASTQMKSLHDKLVSEIATLNTRKTSINAKVSMANTQMKLADIKSTVGKNAGSIADFARMEAKADKMLDEATALDELNSPSNDSVETLAKKYETPAVDIEEELKKLKDSMK